MKYNMYIDSKVSIWKRQYTEIEADTYQEAITKILNNEYTCNQLEYLIETETPISPTDNDSTLEIYCDLISAGPIYSNNSIKEL